MGLMRVGRISKYSAGVYLVWSRKRRSSRVSLLEKALEMDVQKDDYPSLGIYILVTVGAEETPQNEGIK